MGAAALRAEALATERKVREHKGAIRHHRLKLQQAAARLEKLRGALARLGIPLTIEGEEEHSHGRTESRPFHH